LAPPSRTVRTWIYFERTESILRPCGVGADFLSI
jgi:hypothetical protein